MPTEDQISDVKNRFLRKFSQLLLIQLNEYGPEYVANELNKTPDTYVVTTGEGVRGFISQLYS